MEELLAFTDLLIQNPAARLPALFAGGSR